MSDYDKNIALKIIAEDWYRLKLGKISVEKFLDKMENHMHNYVFNCEFEELLIEKLKKQ